MKYLDQLVTKVKADSLRMECLKAVRDLQLHDSWVAAGFIRNFIWDQLSGNEIPPVNSDIDVIYFDPGDTRQRSEQEFENFLQSNHTNCSDTLGSWSVKNQARMHHVNRDRPYQNCEDAITHWPETVTEIAIRLNSKDDLEVLAPFGLDDLYNKTVQPSPHFKQHKLFEYKVRQDKKRWIDRWPNLKISV
ncbi:nucleotidyltransferase family protein [Kiloniella sp.]|uniref:nucleotidyltransferase family protein n=1 Tax=Kiloniella sp. TaxID=1938587 RepID=UPI003B01B1FA